MNILKERPVAVANTFYPGNSKDLQTRVQALLQTPEAKPAIKALVVPHAGYDFSGLTAASAYKALQTEGHNLNIKRVVLLGPCHRVAIEGLALPSVEAFSTPIGSIPIDLEAVKAIQDIPHVLTSDQAHKDEHSLEVQLPFLKTILKDFKLLPLAVGRATPQQVAEVLNRLWGNEETLIVISTDLSHYHDDASARRIDSDTVKYIENFAISLNGKQACGAIPLNGMLLCARIHGLDIERCRISNSADTIGPANRVVGYGSWLLRPSVGGLNLRAQDQQQLLELAKTSIMHGFNNNKQPFPVELNKWPAQFRKPQATFVTIEINRRLRGCRGSLQAIRSLAQDVTTNASDTAFRDPRFAPLTSAEFKHSDVSLSLLENPEPLPTTGIEDLEAKLRPNEDGLIIRAGKKSATFLPSVWEQLPKPKQFIDHLWKKATLEVDEWPENMTVLRYTATKVSKT